MRSVLELRCGAGQTYQTLVNKPCPERGNYALVGLPWFPRAVGASRIASAGPASRGGLGMPWGSRSPRGFPGFPRRLRWRQVGGCRVGGGAVMAKSHGSSGDSTGHPGALVLNVALMGTEVRRAGDTGRWPSSPPRAFSYRKALGRDAVPVGTIRGASGLPMSPRHPPATAGIAARPAARAVRSSSGLRFKKVLKPRIRSARRPAAKRDGSVTILK